MSMSATQDLTTIQTPFLGEISFAEKDVINFAEPMSGFPHLRRFLVVAAADENTRFFWLQSVEDVSVAILLTDPTHFYPDYVLNLSETLLNLLQVPAGEPVLTLVPVSVRPGGLATLNLAAPVLIAETPRRAVQPVVEKLAHCTRMPINTAADCKKARRKRSGGAKKRR